MTEYSITLADDSGRVYVLRSGPADVIVARLTRAVEMAERDAATRPHPLPSRKDQILARSNHERQERERRIAQAEAEILADRIHHDAHVREVTLARDQRHLQPIMDLIREQDGIGLTELSKVMRARGITGIADLTHTLSVGVKAGLITVTDDRTDMRRIRNAYHVVDDT